MGSPLRRVQHWIDWAMVHTTNFVGHAAFLIIHAAFWYWWMNFVEARPWETLTLVVSLEAIVLNTVTMIGLNLMSKGKK